MRSASKLFPRRIAGVLLHPTSLPGELGNGDLGHNAYRFVDFLHTSGLGIWQMLPHGPTHDDGSPYQSLSVHAGNPLWISLDPLIASRWIYPSDADSTADGPAVRKEQLQLAHRGFEYGASTEDREEYSHFRKQNAKWLDNYALFVALREENSHRPWMEWPEGERDRHKDALKQAHTRLTSAIEQVCFEQFLFFRQWHALKSYANEKGVMLFGDLPIYVALDSADVWVHRDQFDLDENGQPRSVAGVPPDYFSETGQRWGNPLFDWDTMERDGFYWWQARIRSAFSLYDLVRIDHFRGFEAYWSIPAESETAINGEWVKAPGDKLFGAMYESFGRLPVVAEDLGVITDEVIALRRQFGMPGMCILQFAFDGTGKNPYLPHNHETDSVVYTGTHDNNTTFAWFAELDDVGKENVLDYLAHPSEPMPWPLIRSAFASVADAAIIPMQDLLGLGVGHRMNTPGTTKGNWQWRFDWQQVPDNLPDRLQHLLHIYGRAPETD